MCSRRSGCVLYLYDLSDAPCQEKQVSGSSKYELVEMAETILRRLNKRKESSMQLGCSFDQVQIPVNVLQGNGYSLKVNNLMGTRRELLKNNHSVRVRLQNPEPFLKILDESAFQSVRDTKIHPMFLVEVRESEMVPSGLELQLTIHKKSNSTLKRVILQQDISTMEWNDITSICTSGRGACPEINIPVKKPAQIWVLHLKHSLCDLMPLLLALMNHQIIFHILLYYQVRQKKVKVRIVGLNENLDQNRKRSKTAVMIAEEEGFLRGCESGPMFLSQKENRLNAEFNKDGDIFNSGVFVIGKNKYAEWLECSFDVKDLNSNVDIKVFDNNGYLQWAIDLNEIVCLDQCGNELQPGDDFESHGSNHVRELTTRSQAIADWN